MVIDHPLGTPGSPELQQEQPLLAGEGRVGAFDPGAVRCRDDGGMEVVVRAIDR